MLTFYSPLLFSVPSMSAMYTGGGGVDAPWSADGGATIWLNNCQNSLKPLEVHTNHRKSLVFEKNHLALALREFCRGGGPKRILQFARIHKSTDYFSLGTKKISKLNSWHHSPGKILYPRLHVYAGPFHVVVSTFLKSWLLVPGTVY